MGSKSRFQSFFRCEAGIISSGQLIALNIMMGLLGIAAILIILTRDDPNTDYDAIAMDEAELWATSFHLVPRNAIPYDWGYMYLEPEYGPWMSANGETLKFRRYVGSDQKPHIGLMLEATPEENGIMREIDEIKTNRPYTLVFDAALPAGSVSSDADVIGVFIDGRLMGDAFQSTAPMQHRIEFKFTRALNIPVLEIKSLSAPDGKSAVIDNIRLLRGEFGYEIEGEDEDEEEK